jgi:hypothetical protein
VSLPASKKTAINARIISFINRYYLTIMKKNYLILLGLTIPLFTNAQEAIPSSGGNASGSGGSVSYTIGQVVYSTNTGTSGNITLGVQQPYEILIISGVEEAKNILLECSAFPNPVTEFLKLKIDNYKSENLSYQLYNMNGKLLKSKKVEGNEIIILMENFAPSTYFLKVTDNNKEIKIFKIIKN